MKFHATELDAIVVVSLLADRIQVDACPPSHAIPFAGQRSAGKGVGSHDVQSGFHILGHLKKKQPTSQAREKLKEWLKETFGDRDDLTVAESPKGSKGALGVSPMKENGGHIAKHSMRITGLCCIEVPRSQLPGFNREEARAERVYKRLTGKSYKPMIREAAIRVVNAYLSKIAGYDRDKLKPGYKGKFVIHEHIAEDAGPHWDIRLQFPVTSLERSLQQYESKGDGEKEYSDTSGSVYRSFVDRKRKIPSGNTKIYLVPVDDHPMSYGSFEGTIPEGYGAGEVTIWDKGTYELIDVEGDKKYVMDFHGGKLKGTYALVKYQDGYLWVKTKDKKASVIDYTRPTLPPQIWDVEKDPPSLRNSIRDGIMKLLLDALEKAEMFRPFEWIKAVYLQGSIVTYNYTDNSDIDVVVIFDQKKIRKAFPELQKLSDDDVEKYLRNIIYKYNGKPLRGTTHPITFAVYDSGEFDSDATFDLMKDKWRDPPKKVPLSFDPDEAFKTQAEVARLIAIDIDKLIGTIVRTVHNLERLDQYLEFTPSPRYQAKRVILMSRLADLCTKLDQWHYRIRDIWNFRYDYPEKRHTYPAYDFSTNWETHTIIFKYLQKWGYDRPVSILYRRLKGNPYLKMIDHYIPD